ncbi:hypothetical protein PMI22_02205, partial [Pseudomonas sp. GM21]|uniref:hypothetical protein n=1 Tax=Pseudomonas sp. GM21 TaxID=1144325 RepID=UPI0002727FA9
MFALGMRLSRLSVSVSGALLVLGATPGEAEATCYWYSGCYKTTQTWDLNNDYDVHFGTGGVYKDGSVTNSNVFLHDQGRATGITVKDKGFLEAREDSLIEDSTLQAGGEIEVQGSAKAIRITVEGGRLELFENAVAEDSTVQAGGEIELQGSAKGIRTTVEDKGRLRIFNSAEAYDSVVQAGGHLQVANMSKAIGTTVDGGTLELWHDAVAENSTVKNGLMVVTPGVRIV